MGASIKKSGILLADGSGVGENLILTDSDVWYLFIKNHTKEKTTDGVKMTVTTESPDGFIIPFGVDNALVGGETFTLSFQYRTNIGNFGQIYLMCRAGSNKNIMLNSSNSEYSLDEWKTFYYTSSFPSTSGQSTYAILIPYVRTVGSWIEIKDDTIELEKGTVASPWAPSKSDDIYTGTHAFFEGYDPASIGDGYVSANEFYEI